MADDIPYYLFDDSENQQSAEGEAYIDDGDLREFLMEYLGDKVSKEEIEEVLKAASDENLSEDDFDNLIDELLLKK